LCISTAWKTPRWTASSAPRWWSIFRLAIFATHFYQDPTHTRPVPYALLAFYLQECGIGNVERRDLSPALESFPSLAGLPEEFHNTFFGGLDYAIIGRKL